MTSSVPHLPRLVSDPDRRRCREVPARLTDCIKRCANAADAEVIGYKYDCQEVASAVKR
jgi:hypothetical protein